jgi:PAS domain S-box-containing protein
MNQSQSKQRLLIADPDPQNVSVLKTMLAAEYGVKIAVDEAETLRRAASRDVPGLILLSIIMPPADGYSVCKKLKADPVTRDIPIILISQPTPVSEPPQQDHEAKGFELGAADYITTPFKKSVVRARIRTHLELGRYRENLEHRVKKQLSRLHAEIQERRDVEDTYRGLVEHARDGIVIVHDLIVKYANPAFCKMIGLPEEELIGAHLKKFLSEEEFIKVTKRYSDRIKGINLPRIYKSSVIHSNGSTIDVELNVSVVPYGRSLAALVFVRDIGEEKAWEYLK